MSNKVIKEYIENIADLEGNYWSNIIESLASAVAVGDIFHREDLQLHLQSSLNNYYNRINGLINEYEPVQPNYPPDAGHYKETFSNLRNNLQLLFSQSSSLRNLAIAAFNRIATERDSLHHRLGIVSGKLRALGLYGLTQFIGKYIGESFTDLGNFNIDSSANASLHIDTDSGLATLPLNHTEVLNIKGIGIEQNYSNGRPGNIHDPDVIFNYDNIYNLVDGEPQTWWEYESVRSSYDVEEGVKLGLIIELSQPEIVNQISVTPLNLGTLSEVSINSIEGSIDGGTWFDLSLYMPLAYYLNESRQDILSVSKSTSIKTNTVSIYTLPILLKYIRIRLSQHEFVRVNSNSSTLYRYAIGIRDIHVLRNEYSSYGELIAKPVSVRAPVSSVLTFAAITNLATQLYTPSFYLSFGNNQYIPFQLASEDKLLSNEVISIPSLSLDPQSINEIGFKIGLTRNDNVFSEIFASEISQVKYRRVESFNVNSDRSPINFATSLKPIDGTLSVMESPIYKVGDVKELGFGNQSYSSGTNTIIDLPLRLSNTTINDGGFVYDDLEVYVNDSLWTRVANLSNSTIDDEHYMLMNNDDFPYTRVKFGNSGGKDVHRSSAGSTGGKALPDGAHVKIRIKPDVLSFNYDSENYNAVFKVPCDGDKDVIKIETQSSRVTVDNHFVPPGVHSHVLHPFVDLSQPITFSQHSPTGFNYGSVSVFEDLKSFVDGNTELVDSGDYSIDPVNGVLYSYDASPTDRITIVSFSHFNRTVLTPDQFELIRDDDRKFIGITIPEKHFKALRVSEVLGAARSSGYSFNTDSIDSPQYYPSISNNYVSGSTTIYLSHGGIIPGSIELPQDIFGTGKVIEVAFIDGISEFLPGNPNDFITAESGKFSVDYRRGVIYLSQSVSTGLTVKYIYALYRAYYDVASYIEKYDRSGAKIEFSASRLTGLSNNKIKVVYDHTLIDNEATSNIVKYYTPIIRDLQIRYN